MLRYRLLSAIVLIPLIVGVILLGGLVYFALVFAGLLVAGFEFFQMTRRAGHHPLPVLGLALIGAFLFDAFARTDASRTILTVALVVSLVAAIFWRRDDASSRMERNGERLSRRRDDASEGWLVGWGLTFAGALYIGVLGASFLLLRDLPNGAQWTGITILTAWATDTGAYIAGMRFGRHGFFTRISPKKTQEGALGGLIGAMLGMLLLGSLMGLPPLHSLAFGLGIGIAATLGDLAESLLKRQVGAKDSGAIVPGHGGILDRIDSLLFAAVFAYYYLIWILRV